MKFAERKTFGIVEEQGGFRPERGTEDQIFILTEVLRARRACHIHRLHRCEKSVRHSVEGRVMDAPVG